MPSPAHHNQAGSQASLQHIHAEFTDIKARNEAQQARVEDILSQRLALEQQAKQVGARIGRNAARPALQQSHGSCDFWWSAAVPSLNVSLPWCCVQVETQIAQTQSAQEQRLNSMLPSARQAYNDLMSEQASLLAEAGRFEEEGAEMSAALAAAEGELSRNGFKQRVLEVQVRVALLKPPGHLGDLCVCSRGVLPSLHQALQGEFGKVLTRRSTAVSCVVSAMQEQIRVLMQRKVELAASEEAAKASPEDQKEVHAMAALQHVHTNSWHGAVCQ